MIRKNIVIVGAGLVGSLLSIYLAKRGHKVRVYERRNDMRKGTSEAGRSINLALSDRGIKALNEVGIIERIQEIAIPMHGRMIHTIDGKKVQQPYGKQGQYINSVSRAELNKKLMDLAEDHGVEILFEHRLQKMDWKADSMDFDVTGKTSAKDFKADIVFAADGAFSSCRLNHMLQHDRFEYEQSYIDFGYKELHIPAGENNTFLLDKNALHIWPRGNYMLIALPNTDGSFTATLFFPFEGDPSFSTIDNGNKARQFFETTFTDASKLMTTLEHDFLNNPTSSLVTVKCFPWVRNDSFAMIGDAAHAIVPFFGQGMNCGFEDCSVLDDLMNKHGDDWTRILDEFQRTRKPDTDAIADLALNNFIEMRDRVSDPKFLLQKKIEGRLYEKFPDQWIPAYSQVTFSPHIRYRDALSNGLRQEEIMREIMQRPDIESAWDDDQLHSTIINKLHSKTALA